MARGLVYYHDSPKDSRAMDQPGPADHRSAETGVVMKRTMLLLVILALAAPAAFGAPAHEIPFILQHNNLFLDHVTLAGQGSYRAMIDTGTTHNIVDLEVAAQLKLEPTGSLPVAATGGGITMPTFDASILAVNGVPLMDKDMPLIGGPLHRESAPIEQTMDLLLGYPLFRRWVVELDFDKLVMRLYEPRDYTPPAGVQAIPVNLALNVPLVKADVEGMAVNLMIDTGANSMLDLYPGFMQRSGLAERHTTYRMPVYGLGGSVDSALMRVSSLTLGAYTLKDLRVYAHSQSVFSSLLDGLIGTEILRRFTVALDYNHSRIYLTPNPSLSEPWSEERAGITALRLGDDYVVVSVADQSPAGLAGLLIGDKVIRVNGKPASETGISGMRTLVRQAPGTAITFTVLREGAEMDMTITLEEYVK